MSTVCRVWGQLRLRLVIKSYLTSHVCLSHHIVSDGLEVQPSERWIVEKSA